MNITGYISIGILGAYIIGGLVAANSVRSKHRKIVENIRKHGYRKGM